MYTNVVLYGGHQGVLRHYQDFMLFPKIKRKNIASPSLTIFLYTMHYSTNTYVMLFAISGRGGWHGTILMGLVESDGVYVRYNHKANKSILTLYKLICVEEENLLYKLQSVDFYHKSAKCVIWISSYLSIKLRQRYFVNAKAQHTKKKTEELLCRFYTYTQKRHLHKNFPSTYIASNENIHL